jgi:predicted DNA-binding antitoxin AbrB/MazE fold protein
VIKAVYENGTIQPMEPIPTEWVEGQELEIVEVSPQEKERLDELDEWYRDVERLAAELDNDPEEWELLDAALREADRIEKERRRREMGLA